MRWEEFGWRGPNTEDGEPIPRKKRREDLSLPAGQEGPERCGGDGRTTNLFYLGSRAFRWLAGVLVRSPTLLAVSL